MAEFSSILPEEVEEELKSAAEISMGTEISQEDCDNIVHLCDQVRVRLDGGPEFPTGTSNLNLPPVTYFVLVSPPQNLGSHACNPHD